MTITIKKTSEKTIKTFAKREWVKFDQAIGFNSRPKPFCFVARKNGQIVGYIKMEIWGGVAYFIEFYQRNGYVNEATVPDHYFGHDWYNMAKKARI